MKKLTVKKGQIIQRMGDFNHKVYHVESGLLRSYAIDKNGKETIFAFAPEGWVAADARPYDAPAVLYIDALEDTVAGITPKDYAFELRNIHRITNWLQVLQTRIIMLQSTSAIERYEHFIATYPDVAQRVPQKMIASYLGVNPETLSAAKSAQARKKSN